jgi:hypothetical protein
VLTFFYFFETKSIYLGVCKGFRVGRFVVEVWTTYRNKIDLIKKNIEFKVQNKIIKKYYKYNSKVHNRADLRVFEVEKNRLN